MFVLLPPSETKAPGGDGPPLDLAALSMTELTPIRQTLVTALTDLAADPETAMKALGLGARGRGEIDRDARLRTSPTMSAIGRYTGVLFDALDVASLTGAQRSRASVRLGIGSALFGALRADDPIPAYRLSASSRLPGMGTLASVWRADLPDAVAAAAGGGLVVDLRSGAYRKLGPIPGAVVADVVTEGPDGTRKTVSHFNKHHKGLLARALVHTTAEPGGIEDVARVAKDAGMRVEIADAGSLTIVTP